RSVRQIPKTGRIRFSRKRAVAAEHTVRTKVTRQVEPGEYLARRRKRLVRQDGKLARALERFEGLGNTWIRASVFQKARIVDGEKARERVRRQRHAGQRERTRHKQRGTVPHHPSDGLLRQRSSTALHDEVVDRFGKIAA